ncbi:MAG: hypothetical protein KDL87_11490, partial [Verrucomicrobiae bacterium]|nr:hypothetical protein [Verrucomicrobiae bacterium]
MDLTYDSHVLKLARVDWKADHARVAEALGQARGRRLILRAEQSAAPVLAGVGAGASPLGSASPGKREIRPPAGPDDLPRALAGAGIDLDRPFDLEIVIRQPVPGAPLREALLGRHGYRDTRDRHVLHQPPGSLALAATGVAAPHPLRRVPYFFRDHGGAVDLVDLHRGATVFLILNGPSFARVDPGALRRPGIHTFGVNNGAHGFRPHYWTCVDDPTRFMDTIWRDPGIQKFVPMGHFDRPVWDRAAGCVTAERVADFPNVIGYRRNEHFQADRWLTEDTINWGNHADHGGGRSVMLAALRLCHLLGFRRVCLLGCDFHMEAGRHYWFPEQRSEQAVRNNTAAYEILH